MLTGATGEEATVSPEDKIAKTCQVAAANKKREALRKTLRAEALTAVQARFVKH